MIPRITSPDSINYQPGVLPTDAGAGPSSTHRANTSQTANEVVQTLWHPAPAGQLDPHVFVLPAISPSPNDQLPLDRARVGRLFEDIRRSAQYDWTPAPQVAIQDPQQDGTQSPHAPRRLVYTLLARPGPDAPAMQATLHITPGNILQRLDLAGIHPQSGEVIGTAKITHFEQPEPPRPATPVRPASRAAGWTASLLRTAAASPSPGAAELPQLIERLQDGDPAYAFIRPALAPHNEGELPLTDDRINQLFNTFRSILRREAAGARLRGSVPSRSKFTILYDEPDLQEAPQAARTIVCHVAERKGEVDTWANLHIDANNALSRLEVYTDAQPGYSGPTPSWSAQFAPIVPAEPSSHSPNLDGFARAQSPEPIGIADSNVNRGERGHTPPTPPENERSRQRRRVDRSPGPSSPRTHAGLQQAAREEDAGTAMHTALATFDMDLNQLNDGQQEMLERAASGPTQGREERIHRVLFPIQMRRRMDALLAQPQVEPLDIGVEAFTGSSNPGRHQAVQINGAQQGNPALPALNLNLYMERQAGLSCAQHAINAAFGGPFASMEALARQQVGADAEPAEFQQALATITNAGVFPETAIDYLQRTRNIPVHTFFGRPTVSPDGLLQQDPDQLDFLDRLPTDRLILQSNVTIDDRTGVSHYVAFHRYGQQWVLLDSMAPAPQFTTPSQYLRMHAASNFVAIWPRNRLVINAPPAPQAAPYWPSLPSGSAGNPIIVDRDRSVAPASQLTSDSTGQSLQEAYITVEEFWRNVRVAAALSNRGWTKSDFELMQCDAEHMAILRETHAGDDELLEQLKLHFEARKRLGVLQTGSSPLFVQMTRSASSRLNRSHPEPHLHLPKDTFETLDTVFVLGSWIVNAPLESKNLNLAAHLRPTQEITRARGALQELGKRRAWEKACTPVAAALLERELDENALRNLTWDQVKEQVPEKLWKSFRSKTTSRFGGASGNANVFPANCIPEGQTLKGYLAQVLHQNRDLQ